MLCCGIGVLAIAAAVSLAVGAQHLGHYVERARANERSLLAEFAAHPICTGRGAAVPRAVRQSRRNTAFSNPS
jgi:hypothetical protein